MYQNINDELSTPSCIVSGSVFDISHTGNLQSVTVTPTKIETLNIQQGGEPQYKEQHSNSTTQLWASNFESYYEVVSDIFRLSLSRHNDARQWYKVTK